MVSFSLSYSAEMLSLRFPFQVVSVLYLLSSLLSLSVFASVPRFYKHGVTLLRFVSPPILIFSYASLICVPAPLSPLDGSFRIRFSTPEKRHESYSPDIFPCAVLFWFSYIFPLPGLLPFILLLSDIFPFMIRLLCFIYFTISFLPVCKIVLRTKYYFHKKGLQYVLKRPLFLRSFVTVQYPHSYEHLLL